MDLQAFRDKVVEAITNKMGQTPSNVEIQYDFVIIDIPKSQVYKVLDFLKTEPTIKLDFLTTMCGIHFNDGGEREFGLMYQLHNMETNERLRIRTYMPKSDLDMPTVSTIFPTANWMEREAYDFYGFNFTGHPSLTRILNMDEMNYHPMRREYALEDGGRTDKDDKYFGR
jgi:NADH-quinone oxidoreductase subunit C